MMEYRQRGEGKNLGRIVMRRTWHDLARQGGGGSAAKGRQRKRDLFDTACIVGWGDTLDPPRKNQQITNPIQYEVY